MKYEKVRAESASKCTMEVRKSYGDDAIILGTRKIKEGGLMGTGLFSHDVYEMEFMVMEKKNPSGSLHDAVRNLNDAESSDSTAKTLKLLQENNKDGNLQKKHELLRENPLEKQALHRMLNDEDPLIETPSDLIDDSDELTDLNEEPVSKYEPSKASMTPHRAGKTAYEDLPVAFSAELPASLDLDERSARHFLQIRRNLVASHLSPDFADAFLGRLDHNLSRNQKQEYHKVIEFSRKKLADMIQAFPDIAPPPGQCRGVLLMGPTGAGKTTTLAKLAAKYYNTRDVSIYSLDHYRLAATEQLKSYADVMSLPFHAPKDAGEFTELIRRDGAEIVLIDSSGIGYRDIERMDRLYELISAIRNEIRLEKHLCLAANLSSEILEKILLAYDRIGFDKIILTKLDEAEFIGAFIEIADKFNRPFSFLCDGQEVPNNISEASSAGIASMVLDKEMSLAAGK